MTTQRLLLAEPPDSSIPTAAPQLRETFRVLDVVANGWIVVLSFTTTTPPAIPQQGDAYLVPAGATGVWAGHQNHLAIFTPVGWIFRSPRYGWIVVIVDQNAPYGKVLQYSGTEWTGWILPASQVSFATSGTDFVSTNLQALMLEINLRFLANESTLADHEARIEVLEASSGGGGGGSTWTNVLTQPFSSNTTGFTSNGTGSWAISGGVLVQSSNTTNGAVFRYTTDVPYAGIRLKADMSMLSTGSPASTQEVGFYIGPNNPAGVPTNCVAASMRYDTGTKTIAVDKFGVGFFLNIANSFTLDAFHALEVIAIGARMVMYFDGVAIGSFYSSDANLVTYQSFGFFCYGSNAQYKNLTIDTLGP